MGPHERKERQRLQVRQTILDAARELFAEQGYDSVTMRKVAEKIEYSPTAIYLHFKDKEQLIRELCDHDFLAFAQEFQKIARTKDPIERLRKAGHAYISFGNEFRQQFRLMFMTPVARPADESTLRRGDPAEDAYAFLLATVSEAFSAGRFRKELKDPELIAQMVWSGVHGVIALEIAKCSDDWVAWKPLARRAKLTVDTLIDGLTLEKE